jgi:hypothetical protein
LLLMAPSKRRTGGKGTAGKTAGNHKPRKRPTKKAAVTKPGIGHNKPPTAKVPRPPPPIPSWATDDQTAEQIAHATAARHRSFRAALGIGTPTAGTPFAQAHDPTHLHQVMLKRIAALEETIAKLATLPDAEQIKPKPLDDSEIEEIRSMLAKVKALPPALAQRPPDAVKAPSKLMEFGDKVVVGLAVWAATRVASAAATALWASCSAQLKLAAQSIVEWLESLPPPPLP